MTPPDTRKFYDPAFLPRSAEETGDGAPTAETPRRQARRRTAAGPVLTPEQITNIIFNETQSLSGPDLGAVRMIMTHSIMNADDRWGSNRWRHAGTADFVLPARMDARQKKILEEVRGAVMTAYGLKRAPGGFDLAAGTTNFNMRPKKDDSPLTWGRKPGNEMELHGRAGPFPDSLGGEEHIYFWRNPDAAR